MHPTANDLGRSMVRHLPAAHDVPGLVRLRDVDRPVWRAAAPYLDVRSNDGHTIYAYGLARALLDHHPEADPEVVLPAILLHDTGWSQVDPEDVLKAIEPGASRHDLVIQHEKEGARIATAILTELGFEQERIDTIVTIIDGHDSRLTALSLDDSLVKDADKLWRLTPHGVDTVMDWFGLDREQAHRLIGSRVHDHLFTDAAKAMARGLAAVASIDCVPERLELG
jgi:HD superfamily phosphodiesterase